MKKILLLLFSILLLFGCETKEEREQRKKDEEIQKITEELTQNETPEEAKADKVVTIFCLTTSKKCESLKVVSEEIKEGENLKLYFFNLDEIKDEVKTIYKTTYELNDYTGYLPYIMIVSKNKLISTHTDTLDKESFIEYLKENKIISSDL